MTHVLPLSRNDDPALVASRHLLEMKIQLKGHGTNNSLRGIEGDEFNSFSDRMARSQEKVDIPFVDDFGERDSLTRLRSGNLGIKWPTHHAEIKARRN